MAESSTARKAICQRKTMRAVAGLRTWTVSMAMAAGGSAALSRGGIRRNNGSAPEAPAVQLRTQRSDLTLNLMGACRSAASALPNCLMDSNSAQQDIPVPSPESVYAARAARLRYVCDRQPGIKRAGVATRFIYRNP